MLAVNATTRVYLYMRNVDMRRSYDGLMAIVQTEFASAGRASGIRYSRLRILLAIALIPIANHDSAKCFRILPLLDQAVFRQRPKTNWIGNDGSVRSVAVVI